MPDSGIEKMEERAQSGSLTVARCGCCRHGAPSSEKSGRQSYRINLAQTQCGIGRRSSVTSHKPETCGRSQRTYLGSAKIPHRCFNILPRQSRPIGAMLDFVARRVVRLAVGKSLISLRRRLRHKLRHGLPIGPAPLMGDATTLRLFRGAIPPVPHAQDPARSMLVSFGVTDNAATRAFVRDQPSEGR